LNHESDITTGNTVTGMPSVVAVVDFNWLHVTHDMHPLILKEYIHLIAQMMMTKLPILVCSLCTEKLKT